MATALKIFTTGIRGRVPAPLALALGISAASNHCQARILVSAPNKATAHMMLAARGLGVTMGDREFRQAMGNDVDCLSKASLFTSPVVLALPHTSGPVAMIDTDGYTIIGTYRAGMNGGSFAYTTPEPAPQPATAEAVPADVAERQMLAAQLAGATERLNQLTVEAAEVSIERNDMCQLAVELKMIQDAANAMGCSPTRVYQLAQKSLRRRAEQGEFRPGIWVTVEDDASGTYPIAEVVEQPEGALVPYQNEAWVWVRYTNGSVVPKRARHLRYFVPPCSQCPPAEQESLSWRVRGGNTSALSVHMVAKHGTN